MKLNTAKYSFVFLLTLLVACKQSVSGNTEMEQVVPAIPKDYKTIAAEAKAYCTLQNLNTDYFILVDLGLHSGLERFYVWDFKGDSISKRYMVSHGCGENPWMQTLTKDSAVFSNVSNSHCSSLGKYIIGERGYSQFGVHVKYLLHGKDSSNSNALMRDIVFHSWEMVPDKAVYPEGTPEGWGCPAISNAAFLEIDKMIQNSNLRPLMWIVE